MREFLEASTRASQGFSDVTTRAPARLKTDAEQGFREHYAHAREGRPVTVNTAGKQWGAIPAPSRKYGEDTGAPIRTSQLDNRLTSLLIQGGNRGRSLTQNSGRTVEIRALHEFSEAIKGQGLGTDGTPLKGVSRPVRARARGTVEFCHALKGRAQEIRA